MYSKKIQKFGEGKSIFCPSRGARARAHTLTQTQMRCLHLVSEGIEEQEAAQHMSRGHLLLLFSTIMDTIASDNVSALKMSYQQNFGVR